MNLSETIWDALKVQLEAVTLKGSFVKLYIPRVMSRRVRDYVQFWKADMSLKRMSISAHAVNLLSADQYPWHDIFC